MTSFKNARMLIEYAKVCGYKGWGLSLLARVGLVYAIHRRKERQYEPNHSPRSHR